MSEAGQSQQVMDHWEALKRYDDRRRRSMAEPTTIIHDDESEYGLFNAGRADEYQTNVSYTDAYRRQGTDQRGSPADEYLPPMPAEAPQSRAPPPGPSIRPPAFYSPTVQDEASAPLVANPQRRQSHPQPQPAAQGHNTIDDQYQDDRDLRHEREKTPPALNGQNAVLVDREMQRLREKKPLAVRRKWRILAGKCSLPMFVFTLFIGIKSIVAYLHLSPSKWVFSDAKNGTGSSPDSGLRSLALAEFVMSMVSIVGILFCGIYLRATRRRVWGRRFVWIPTILAASLQIMLSMVNLAIIADWHKHYSEDPQNPLAHTRDVGQRCAGTWDMDIAWDAASSSVVAKPDGHAPACPRDPEGTTKAYLIAGGVRLCLFAVFSAMWLGALARYNRSLRHDLSRTETLEESPEMLNLLHQDGDVPATPQAYNHDIGRYDAQPAEAPRLSRFSWQREASVAQSIDSRNNVRVYGNVSRNHPRGESAGSWSTAVLGVFKSAVRGEGSQGQSYHNLGALPEEDEAETECQAKTEPARYVTHKRNKSQLGVGGWLQRIKSAFGGEESDEEDDFESIKTDSIEKPSAVSQQSKHGRTPSQERRESEGRHAAVRQAYGRRSGSGAPIVLPGPKSGSLRERCEARRQNRALQQTKQSVSTSKVAKPSQRDSLQPMPHLLNVPQAQWPDEFHDAMYWHDEADLGALGAAGHRHAQEQLPRAQEAPVYVRTMGRLVRRMSLIESVGSQERRSRSRNRSASVER